MSAKEYREKQRIINEYIDKGYNKQMAKFAPASLTSEQIQQLFDKGILSAKINNIFNAVIHNATYHTSDIFGKRAKEAGVKFAIDLSGVVLLFMEDYLVVTHMENSRFKTDGRGNSEYTYEQTKLMPFVLSYNEIADIELAVKNFHGAWNGKTVTKTGDPLKGAVIGAVIGGTTGAVIGAAASGRPKTETVISPGSFNADYFYVSIKGYNIDSSYEIELFSLDRPYGELKHGAHNWTWAMNAVLTGKYEINGAHQVQSIQELYNNILQQFLKKIDRFQLQEDLLELLVSKYECNVVCDKFATPEEFYEAISSNPKTRDIVGASECLGKINLLLEKKTAEQERLELQLNKLQDERAEIKFWKLDAKKQKDKEILDAEHLLEEIKQNFYQDTTSQFYEWLKQETEKIIEPKMEARELSANKIAIIDLLRDGTKRTISEMKMDSGVLAKVSNQRLSAMLRELVESGILEKNEFARKVYFSIADNYCQ